MNLVAFLLLFAPLIVELIDDRNGEALQKKGMDVFVRLLIAGAGAVLGWLIANKPIVDGFILSLAIHFFFFDYLIVAILNRRVYEKQVNWFTHLGKSFTDDVLRQWSPSVRFIIKISILLIALTIYLL